MKEFLKKKNLKETAIMLVYMIIGVLFLAMPVKIFNFVEMALCVILLIVGVVCIVVYSLMSVEDKEFKTLLYGIILLSLGLCVIFVPRSFGIILSLIIGYGGVSLILSGIKLKKKSDKSWISEFVIGIIVSVLSVLTLILSGTNVAKKIISIFFGIILLINGIYSLIQMIVLKKKQKEQNKYLQMSSKVQEDEMISQNQIADDSISNENQEESEENSKEDIEEEKSEK